MEQATVSPPSTNHNKTPLPEPLVRELKTYIAGLPEKDGQLINVLKKAQELFGYLPRKVQVLVAEELDMPLAHVYGVVTFYAFFTMQPRGRHPILVCQGTACFVKGGPRVLRSLKDYLKVEEGEVTEDGLFSVNTVRCVGGCALAPVMMIDDRVYGKVTPAQIPELLAHFREKEASASEK